MSRGKWARTLGKNILSPAICDRCRLRGDAASMIHDPNSPGLFVHRDCADEYDPWRLPPRISEDITIPHPRRDADLSTTVDTASLLNDIEG